MFHPKLAFALLPCLAALSAQGAVEIIEEAGKVTVSVGGQPLTEYIFQDPAATHVYFYPLIGPDGVRMTRDFPMKVTAGEDNDHPHHRSLWFAHGLVNGVDFWSEKGSVLGKGAKLPLGAIVHDKFLEVKGGEQVGVISALNKWVGPDGVVPLTSVETVRFHEGPPSERVIDFEETLIAGEKEVVFGDTKEGAMALRLNEELRLKPNKAGLGSGHILSSTGLKDGEVWGTRADWVDYTGTVGIGGKPVGVAMFDHPANPHHPTRWHARDYGLFAANPFANHEMDKTLPEGSGELKLAAGEKAVFRYRLYLHASAVDAADLAKRYEAYAHETPP